MWNQSKSIILSNIIIKLSFLIAAAALFFPPYYARLVYENPTENLPRYIAFLSILYLALAIGMVVLIRLDRLLNNIRRGEVFVAANTGHLQVISYGCLAAGALFVGFAVLVFDGVILSAVLLFLGLILRVLKNVFEQAVILREDSDATI